MRTFFKLCLITAIAVLVHGYHLGADDAEIYVPAIKKAANPLLYPFGDEFFMAHAHWSLFPEIVGESARITGLPVNTVIFLCYIAGVFPLLLACWQLAGVCFANEQARWAGVALVAAVFSVPVAGTALTIMDPYVTARTLSTPATMLALAAFVRNRPRNTAIWLLVTAFLHPQMCVYGTAFVFCAAFVRRKAAVSGTAYALAALGPILDFQPAQGPAREALLSRTYFFVSNWTWYEWAGVFAPLGLFFWASKHELRGTTSAFRDLARTVAPFGMLFTTAACVLSSSSPFENLARVQPMRAFHVVYVLFFMMLGGLLGEYVLKDNAQRWPSYSLQSRPRCGCFS